MSIEQELEVQLSIGLLRSGAFDVEASTLEALAQDRGVAVLDELLSDLPAAPKRGGAFGIEILGAVLIPVVVEAVRQFWASYQKELMSKLGTLAANATVTQLKHWFTTAPAADTQEVAQLLATKIREVGAKRGLRTADVEALVAATAPTSLGAALSDGR